MEPSPYPNQNLRISSRLMEDLSKMTLTIPDYLMNTETPNPQTSSKNSTDFPDKNSNSTSQNSKQSFKIRDLNPTRPKPAQINPQKPKIPFCPNSDILDSGPLGDQFDEGPTWGKKSKKTNLAEELFGIEENDNVSNP